MNIANINEIRSLFPQLATKVRGKDFIYFDNAATTLKPKSMIDAITNHLSFEVSNIHRGIHYHSETGTRKYEETRNFLAEFMGAKYPHEVIFTKGTTDSLNLIAQSFGGSSLKKGDTILLSQMEHHSNIVPWQLIAERTSAKIKVVPVKDNGELDYTAYLNFIKDPSIKIVSITHISNTLGTINPIKKMIADLRVANPAAKFVVDGAQAIAHLSVNVQDLDCDFYVFSAHKAFGPTGFGVLYGKEEILNKMPPYQGGGSMIHKVTFEKTTYHDLPNKFEAGTPAIAEGISFIESLKLIKELDLSIIAKYEDELLHYATAKLKEIKDLKIIGEALNKAAVISFVIDGIHPQDLGTLLDQQGIAIRTGHHCTQPLMERFGVTATSRASFCFYNTKSEIDTFVNAIHKAITLLK